MTDKLTPSQNYNRRNTILGLSAALVLPACATTANDPTANSAPQQRGGGLATYSENDLIDSISNHLGVTSESAASTLERLFKDSGRPSAYITGEEGGGAFIGGARYGKGTLWMKNGTSRKVYWQGPSVGFDWGIDASKVFTLVYGLNDPEYIFRRFPGVDGSAFLVAGMAVHYQKANGVTLAPVRSGVGARLGVNVGYTSFTRKRSIIPL